MNEQDLAASSALIIKDFQLDSDALSLASNEISQETLLAKLTAIVNYLLSKDFNRLMNALYRIDVSEEKLKRTLASNTDNTAKAISELILERELQKVETRKKYSS